jgi:phosphatidylserine/phosphatidylglycerophosphate/cardiolipin synthase-like enzyme
MKKLLAPVLFGVIALTCPVVMASPAPQIVQTIPVETGLAEPDLPQAKETWLAFIKAAKHTIDIGQFYASSEPGKAIDAVLTALEEAAARGVKIRFLICKAMLDQDPAVLARIRAIKNLELRIFDLKALTGGILHAKYWIIDDETIYIGSQNFDWRSLEHIHETGALIKNRSLAKKLLKIFDADWTFAATGVKPVFKHGFPSLWPFKKDVELTASPEILNPPGIRSSIKAILQMIGEAKETIQAQALGYSLGAHDGPWTELDDALRAAAKRGVKVQLMVSDWSVGVPAIDYLKSLALVPNIKIKIASIPDASTGFIPYARVIHSKYFIFDGKQSILSTSNFEKDYFYASRNLELIFRRQDTSETMGRIFNRLWTSPYAADLDVTKTYVPRKRD